MIQYETCRDYETCREWLESYREIQAEVCRLQDQHLFLLERSTRVTTSLRPTPGGGGGKDRDRTLAELADADLETVEAVARMRKKGREIERFINGHPDRAGRIILRMRYLTGQSWRDVRRSLAKSGLRYSEERMYRLHRDALAVCEQRWINMQNEEKEIQDIIRERHEELERICEEIKELEERKRCTTSK